jgi:hypothetical protein
MTSEPDIVERIIDILRSDGSYSKLKGQVLLEKGFSFDALLTSEDPMSLVVIEHKDRADERTLRDYVRQLRSFVWALFADGKRFMVSAVLVLGDELSGASGAALTKELSGTCRVFLISETMTDEKLRAELISLSEPEFAKSRPKQSNTDRLLQEISSIGESTKSESAIHLVKLVKGSRSAEEVSRKLLQRFKQLVREVEDAPSKRDD